MTWVRAHYADPYDAVTVCPSCPYDAVYARRDVIKFLKIITEAPRTHTPPIAKPTVTAVVKKLMMLPVHATMSSWAVAMKGGGSDA